uniref:hypothetical protein n=1 Tax=Bacillus velezensis TaxID=492670 RepID=UPI001C92F76C
VCYEVWWWLISFLMRDGWGGVGFENLGFGLGGVYGRKAGKKKIKRDGACLFFYKEVVVKTGVLRFC